MYRMSRPALTAALLATLLTLTVPAPVQATQPPPSKTLLVSAVATGGTPRGGDQPSGEGDLGGASISADGRYVAFATRSAGMIGGSGASVTAQVYLRDTETGTTRAISATAAGLLGDADSVAPSVSGDGTRVAYLSKAANLVPGITGGTQQAFLWSSETGESVALSVSDAAPHGAGNAPVSSVTLSRDGSVAAFASDASNLTPESTRDRVQIFARDILEESTTMVSVDSSGDGASSGASSPAISTDGTSIAFISQSTLGPVSARSLPQAYVWDRTTSLTSLVSINLDSTSGGDGAVRQLSISGDGRRIAFTSTATDVAPPSGTGLRLLLRDLPTGVTKVLVHNASPIKDPALSEDGHYLAFRSSSTTITPDGKDFFPVLDQVYLTDTRADTSILVSRPISGSGAGNDASASPSISRDGSFVAFSSRAGQLIDDSTTGTSQVYLRNTTIEPRVDRIGGADRFGVSAAISAESFPAGADYAYVASGAVFSDALSASAAAGLRNAPVLLTGRDSLSSPIEAELVRLHPEHIVLVGGTSTVSPAVEARLKSFSPDVQRIAGTDRYAVSVAVAQWTFPSHPTTAYVASGAVFPDALSGSAAAGHARGPVLLVPKDAVPEQVDNALTSLAPAKIVVLGGRDSISDGVVASLSKIAPTTRINGSDRFAVSAAVSASVFAANAPVVYVASGAVFPDALSGSAAAIYRGAPVLLITSDAIPADVQTELSRLSPRRVVVIGGTTTISDSAASALASYLAH